MKKNILGIFLLVSFVSNAQDAIQKSKLHFGLRTGLSIPSVTFGATTAPEFSENIYFGALIEYKSDDIGLELAGTYLQTTSDRSDFSLDVPNVTISNYYELKSVLTSFALASKSIYLAATHNTALVFCRGGGLFIFGGQACEKLRLFTLTPIGFCLLLI